MIEINIEEAGYGLAKGAFRYLGYIFCPIIILLALLMAGQAIFGWGIDDTDVSGWDRSGLRLHLDAKTGVQYLSDGKGGLTPRIDRDGNLLIQDR